VQQFIRSIQSALRACIGSIEAARRAGMNAATVAQITSSRIAPRKIRQQLQGRSDLNSRIRSMTDWFARPVLHVKNVETSLRFYINQLGFTSPWRYDEDGRVYVAQVDRQGCALILADSWPEKIGKGLMFISLNVEPQTREAEVAALDALRAELEAKGVLVKEGSWGYRLLVVDDLDGNQLFFNYPNETASGKIVRDEA
jgi:uncharacterized glyoxalase superfamily protein PhnB